MKIKITLGFDGELDGYNPTEVIAITLAEAKLNDISSRGGTLSNRFGLDKTANNKTVLGLLDNNSNQDSRPYTKHNCKIDVDGMPIFYGFALIEESSSKYYLRVFGSTSGFFETLGDRTIREIDLSAYDMDYNATNVNGNRGALNPVIFPNINYGRWTDTTKASVFHTDFFPAVNKKTILDEAAIGYTITGLPIDRYILASGKNMEASNSVPCNAVSTVDKTLTDAALGYEDIAYFDSIVNNRNDYILNDSVAGTFGTFISFGTTNQKNVIIRASVDYVRDGGDGAGSMVLSLKSGSTLYDSITVLPSTSGTYVFEASIGTTNALSLNIGISSLVVPTDSVQILTGSTFEVVSGNVVLLNGSNIPIEDTLPAIKIKDLFLNEATRQNALILVDETEKTIDLIPFNDIAAKIPIAKDWSNKVDHTDKPKYEYRLSDYAQSNLFKWKEGSEYDVGFVANPSIGEGDLMVNDEGLNLSKTMYTSPFVFSAKSEGFTNEPQIMLVPRYSDNSIDWDEADNDVKEREVVITLDTTHLITITSGGGAVSPQANATLPTWQDELDSNYTALSAALLRTKIAEVLIRLNTIDIQEMDFTTPVFLLGNYWFIREVKQFKVNRVDSTIVKLLRL